MTIEDTIKNKLIENGLFPDQANAVVYNLKKLDICMDGRWSEDASGYPVQLLAVLWMSAKDEAVKWIDENKPRHWARPMFAE